MVVHGMVYAWILGGHDKARIRKLGSKAVILGCISVFSVITTLYCECSYKNTGILKDDQYELMISLTEDYPDIEPKYRYRNYQNINIFIMQTTIQLGFGHLHQLPVMPSLNWILYLIFMLQTGLWRRTDMPDCKQYWGVAT